MSNKKQFQNSSLNSEVVKKTYKSHFTKLTRVMAAFTASLFLVSSNLAYAAQSNGLGGHNASNNPMFEGLSRREIRQQIRQERHDGIGIPERNLNLNNINNGVVPTPTVTNPPSINNVHRNQNHQNNRAHSIRNSHQVFQTQESGRVIKLDNGANLNLTSDARNITLGDKLFADAGQVTIDVGGEKKTLYAGSQVTAAEYVAAKQALNGGQTVVIDANGKASGGQIDLNTISATRNTMRADSLTVASGVTAVGDFGKHSSFRMAGDLDNYGSIYAISSGARHSGEIKADNITNQDGALISANAGDNFGNKGKAIDLTLTANKNFTNLGTVESSGDLNINGTNIKNAGTISSVGGNVTLDTPVPAELNVDNNGGTINAIGGAINVRAPSYNAAFNSNVVGGDLNSKELNLHTGQGLTTVDVGQLTGTVNGSGAAAHVSANTETLTIGKQCLTGDPVYKNAAGNIVLDGDIVVGETLAILASGNITSTAGLTKIDAHDGTGNGQDIYIIAGYTLTNGGGAGTDNTNPIPSNAPIPTNANLNVNNGGAGVGGNIDFTASSGLQILAQATQVTKSGGNVLLTARANGANTVGSVLLAPNSQIDTSGSTPGTTNGNITVWAGRNAAGNQIQLGELKANGGVGTSGGNITVQNRQSSAGGGVTFNTNGQITAGSFTAAGPTLANAGIAIGDGSGLGQFITSHGNVVIGAGGGGANLTLGNGSIITAGGSVAIDSTGTGNGNTSITANGIFTSGGAFQATANGNVVVSSSINTSGAAAGGNVLVRSDLNSDGVGNVQVNGSINTTGTGAAGGSVTADVNGSASAGQSVSISGAIDTSGTTGGDVTVTSGNSVVSIGSTITSTTGGDVTLTTAAGNNNISLGGDITAGSITLNPSGTGVINTPATINLTTDGLTLNKTLNSGGTVTIQPLTAGTTIGLAGGAGTLNISAAELNLINASTLNIGNNTSGNITVGANINVSATYNLNITGGGNLTTGVNDFTLGSRNLNINMVGNITTDAITATTGNIDLTAANTTTGALQTSSGNITVNSTNNTVIGSITTTSGVLSITSGGTTQIGTTTSSTGDLIITSAGNITVGTTLLTGAGADIFLTSTGGGITTLGNLQADPIVMLAVTDINLGGSVTANDGIVLITQQNINTTVAGATINGSNATGNGGQVVLIAGAAYTNNPGVDVTINGASGTGGNVNLIAAGGINTLTAQGALGTGGNISLIAYSNGATGGSVLLPVGSSTVTTGQGANTSGNLQVFAGATSGTAIQMGNITTNSAANGVGGGQVRLQAQSPISGAVISTAAGTTGNIAGGFLGGTVQAADISVANINARGSSVFLVGGRNVGASLVNVSARLAAQDAGSLNVLANGTDALDINAAVGSNFIGTILANGGSTSGQGGSIFGTDNSANGIRLSPLVITTNSGTFGGTINLFAPNGPIALLAGTSSVNNANGFGGVITLQGASITVPGGNAALQATGTTSGGSITVNALTGGNMDIGTGANQFQINAGAQGSITLSDAGGTITNTNTGVLNAQTISINTSGAGNNIVNNGTITGLSTTLQATGGNVILNSATTGTQQLVVIASTGGNISGSGLLTGDQIDLQATNIGVGVGGRLNINTTNNATGGLFFQGAGNVFLNAIGDLRIRGASTAGVVMDILAAGNITQAAGANLNAINFLTLRSTGGTIDVGANINSSVNTVSLRAFGNITNSAGTVSANIPITGNVSLTSDTGSVGTSTAARINVSSTSLTANAAQNSVFINVAGGTDITGANSALNTYDVLASGTLGVSGTISAATVILSAADFNVSGTVTGTSSISLNSGGSITGANITGSLVTPQLNLTAVGNIGTDASNRLVIDANNLSAVSTTGSVFIQDTDDLTLNGASSAVLGTFDVLADTNLSSTASGDVTAIDVVLEADTGALNLAGDVTGTSSAILRANNSITNSNVATITTPDLTLSSSAGSIGTSAGSRLNVDTTTLRVLAQDNVFVADTAGGVDLSPLGSFAGLTFDVAATGVNADLTTSGTVNGTNVFLSATRNISTGATVTGSASVTMTAGNNLANNAAINGPITSLVATAGGVQLLAAVNGSTSVSITQANSIVDASINGNINSPQINLTTTAGDIGVSSATPLTIDATNLTVNATGAGGDVFVFDPNTVNIGAGSSSANNDIDIRAGGILTIGGNLTAGNNILLQSNGSTVDIEAQVHANNTLTINANNNIITTLLGVAEATNYVLTAGQAIGGVQRFNAHSLGTNNFDLTAGSTVFISNNTATNLDDSDAVTSFDFQSAGLLTVVNNATVTAPIVILSSSSTVDLGTNATVNGGTRVDINSGLSITDANFGGGSSINTPQLNLVAITGNIGVDASNRLNIDAAGLSAFATIGSVFIADSNSVTLQGSSSSAPFGTFDVQAAGTLTVAATFSVSGQNVVLTSTGADVVNNGSVSASSSISISSNTDITSGALGTLSAPQINLTSTNGSIGTSTLARVSVDAQNLTLNAANNVFVSDPNTVNIGAGSSGAGNIFDVVANGNLTASGNITASTVRLTSTTGNITQTLGTIDAAALTLTSNGTVLIGQTSNTLGSQTFTTSGTGDFSITTQETGLILLDASTADDFTLVASAGSVVTVADSTYTGAYDITTSDYNVDNFIQADSINIHGPNLSITGSFLPGALISAPNGITITTTAGDLNFFRNLDISGAAIFNGTNGNSIIINALADVQGDSSITLNTCSLILNGNLQGNPLIFNCPLGAGTIANSTGDVNLSSDLVFNGQSLAIIASGSINDTGISNITLNTTSGTNDGGTLTMIAGFNFTPATPGQVNLVSTIFTITGPSAGGSVNLGTVNISTGVNVLTGGDGGDVNVYAHNGTVSLGSVNTNSIAGDAGNLTVIAQNGITINGNSSLLGNTADGNVQLQVADPTIIGGAIMIADGEQMGPGNFVAGPTTGGNIDINADLNAGQGNITLSGGQFGGNHIFQIGGTLTANLLQVFSNLGGAIFDQTNVNSLAVTSNGGVLFSDNNGPVDLTLVTGNVNLDVTSSDTITVSNVLGTVTGLLLSQTNSAGSIEYDSNVQTSGPLFASSSGDINVNGVSLDSAGLFSLTATNNINASTGSSLGATGSTLGLLTINGAITIDGTSITTTSGNAISIAAGTDFSALNASPISGAGQVTIDANGGDVSLDAAVQSTSGSVALHATGDILIFSSLTAAVDVAVQSTGNGLIQLLGAVQAGGANGAILTGGTVTIGIGSSVTSVGDIALLSDTGNVAVIGTLNSSAGEVEIVSAQDIIQAVGGTITAQTNADIRATGDVTTNANIFAVTGFVTLASMGTGSVTVNSSQVNAGDDMTINATNISFGGINTLNANNGISLVSTNVITGAVGNTLTINGGTSVTANQNIATPEGSITINAITAGGTIFVQGIDVSGQGGFGTAALTRDGTDGGFITLTADNTVSANFLNAFGGGGAGGDASGAIGGDGGNGGTISVTSSNANVQVLGPINTSGGGGGGQAFPSGPPLGGGDGGDAGTINVTGATTVNIFGPILAAGGGGGAGVSVGWTAASSAGGASFGGGGGGGDGSAGGGGYFGGGGAGLFGTGAGGGIQGGGAGGNGGANGTFGNGGNGTFGTATGGQFGQSGFDNGTGPTLVGQAGNGNTAGAGGNDGAINITGGAITTSGTVNSELGFGGPFANTSIYGGTVTLTGNLGTVSTLGETLASGNINISSAATMVVGGDIVSTNGDVSITTNHLSNTYTIAGNNVTVASFAGSGLTLDSAAGGGPGGVFQAFTGNTNITATDLNLLLQGTQTFSGTTNFNVDAFQDITVDLGAVYTGNNTVNLNTCNLFLLGTITGNPLNFNCPLGAGTIANSLGDVDLSGLTLNFNGQFLSIIAAGSVLANGETLIDLSSGPGGGSLNVIAGYTFTPATVGQVNNVTTTFTLGAPSATGGNIDLTGLTINTSSVTGPAGDVTLIAHAGTPNTGFVTVADINASSTGTDGGNVFIIAEGGFTGDNITTTGGTGASGNVSITVGTPTIVGGPVIIANGERFGTGTFVVNTPTAGDISFTSINAGPLLGGAIVSLTGALGATDSITGDVTASALNLNVGAGTATFANSDISAGFNLFASSAATVTFSNETGDFSINGSGGSAAILDVTATGTIDMTSGNTNLASLTLNGSDISFSTGVFVAGPVDATATTGDITVATGGSLTGSTVTLDAANDILINGQLVGGTMDLTVTGDITQDANGAVTVGGMLTINMTGGTVTLDQSTSNSIDALTVNATGAASVSVDNANNDIQLNSVGTTDVLSVITTGTLDLNTALSLTTLTLIGGGTGLDIDFSIATNGTTDIEATAGNLTVVAASGGIDAGVGDLTLATGAGNIVLNDTVDSLLSIDLTTTGGNITQDVNGVITTPTLNVNLNGGTPGNATLNLAANTIDTLNGAGGGTITFDNGATALQLGTVGAAQSLIISTTAGISTTGDITTTGDIDLTTDSITNAFDMTANSITVQSNAGQGLIIDGGLGGSFTATGAGEEVLMTATFDDATLFGDITFGSAAQIFATLGTMTITVDSLADVTGLQMLTLNACDFDIQGSIVGNPLVFNNTCGGTIVNTIGDVVLTGALSFVGQAFAVISTFDIDFTGVTSISTSDGAGGAGNITLIAGYNITPPTPGGQIQDSTNPYTIGTASATGGSINLGGVNFTATGLTTGGNLTAVAAAGSDINSGNISLGNIDLTGGTTNGNLLVIAPGNTTLGTVTGTNVVTLSAANATLTGVVILNGAVNAGTIATGTLTGGNVNVATNLVGNVLNANVGAGGTINIANSNFLTLNTTGGGAITLANELNNLALNNVGGTGQDLSITNTAGIISSTNAINLDTIVLDSDNGFAIGGVITAATQITLTTGVDLTNAQVAAASMVAPTLLINTNVAGADVGTTGTAFQVGAGVATIRVNSLGLANINSLTTTSVNLGASTVASDLTFLSNQGLVVTGNVTTTDGDISIVGTHGVVRVNNNVIVTANGLTATNGNLTLGNALAGQTNAQKKTDFIQLGANAQLLTNASAKPNGNILIQMGNLDPSKLKELKNPPLNVVYNRANPNTDHIVGGKGGKPFFAGKKNAQPVSNVTAINATVTFSNNGIKKNMVLEGGNTITADPPRTEVAPTLLDGLSARSTAAGNLGAAHTAPTGGHNDLGNIATNGNTTELNLGGIELGNNNANLVTAQGTITSGNTADAMTAINSIYGASNVAGFSTSSVEDKNSMLYGLVSRRGAQDDNSYMVSSEGPTSIADAAICSDTDLGTAGFGVKKMAHTDRVVLKQGNVLFVPFVDTVVETPQGNVTIHAKSVALVHASGDKLAVYDLDDSHKGSVTVEAHGQKLTLAPGSHLTVANDEEFAQVNAIEAIQHRNVATKAIKDGVKVHTSEFSIHSAVASVKPLAAVMNSKHAQAKKVADKLVKTSAIILTLGGNKGAYQNYFKPALTAMAK